MSSDNKDKLYTALVWIVLTALYAYVAYKFIKGL